MTAKAQLVPRCYIEAFGRWVAVTNHSYDEMRELVTTNETMDAEHRYVEVVLPSGRRSLLDRWNVRQVVEQ